MAWMMHKNKMMIGNRITKPIACFLAVMALTLNSVSAADQIKVGVILPLTGKLAKFGQIENKSYLMAVDEINAAGGVNGKKIELIIEDTSGKSDVGRSAIEKLITRDKVVVVGGGCSSTVTWAAISIAQQNNVPFLVNTGSADRITEQGWEYIFRLNPPVSEYSGAFKSFAQEVASDIKTVVILHMNSVFGAYEAGKIIKQAEDLGFQIVLKQSFESNAADFKPLLTNVQAKKPDLVYLIAHSIDASLLMHQCQELKLNPKLFVGGAVGFTLPEFQENAGHASEYVYSTTLWTPSASYPGAQKYHDTFAVRYGIVTDYHGAQAYAAMYVIADALKRTKTLTPQGVRNALAKTDMMTVLGPVKFISYDKKVQQNKLPTMLVQWINGELKTVWPKEIATQKYIYPTPKWAER
jgi:branched-chain amino acid transport system substrate-binding protein